MRACPRRDRERTQASPTHAQGKEVFLSEAKISFKSRDTINPLTSLTSPKREKRGRRKTIPLKEKHPLQGKVMQEQSRQIIRQGSNLNDHGTWRQLLRSLGNIVASEHHSPWHVPWQGE